MRRPSISLLLLVVPGAMLWGDPVHAQSGAKTVKVDCSAVLEKMRADIAVDPGRLILAVEDALTTNEDCACPIIRTAIDLAGRDPALTTQIVVAGIRMVPSAADRITECGLAEAPAATIAIRAALSKELGEAATPWLAPVPDSPPPEDSGSPAPEPVIGAKYPAGKAPALVAATSQLESASDAEEFWPAVGISGIYVIPPIANRNPPFSSPPGKVVRKVITTRKTPPRRPSSPLTRDIPE